MPTFNGTAGADYLNGSDGDDVIHGAGGNDTLSGSAGADRLYGEDGDDFINGGAGADTISGGAGNDTLMFGAGDTVSGDEGDDYFEDSPSGFEGSTIDGGAGFDTIDLHRAGVQPAVYLDDAVGTGVRVRNVETVLALGTVFGGSRNDVIRSLHTGRDVSSTFHGGGGDDLLVGQSGSDFLYGDAGNDVLQGGNGTNLLDGGEGFDMAVFSSGGALLIDLNLSTVQLPGGVYDTLVSIEGATGGMDADRMFGAAGANTLIGADGDDHLEGGGGDDLLKGGAGFDWATYTRATSGVTVSLGDGAHATGSQGTDTFESIEGLVGSAFNDVLTGDAGDNRFVGGAGDDRIEGGAGEDVAYFETAYGAPAPTVSYDGVQVIVTGQGIGRDVLTGVEVVSINGVRTEVANLPVEITGTAGADVLNGGEAWDTLRGGAGDDVLNGAGQSDRLYGEDGDDHLNGGEGADTLSGGAGRDTLDGGDGRDEMAGGAGDDTYHADGSDNIVELTGEGIDTVITATSFSVSVGVENLILTGDADLDGYGNAGNNRIVGNAGANRLYGLDGDDVLVGGLGNDTYVMNTTAGDRDTIIEEVDGGIDTIIAYRAFSLVGTEVENLILEDYDPGDLTGNHLDNEVTGNNYANLINGLDGADVLRGEWGDDILNGGAGDDVLVGGMKDDTLSGGAGVDRADYSGATGGVAVNLALGVSSNDGQGGRDTLTGIENATGSLFGDVLTGDSGANRLLGLAGNDQVNGGDGDDVLRGGAGVDVLNGGAGIDTADYSSATVGMRAQLNNGTSSNDGEGGTDTLSGIENLTGSAFDDTLIGDGVANVLRGGLGADTILGLAGNDVIWGGSGVVNQLQGGLGDDRYVLEANDSVVEVAGEGNDTVEARINAYVLALNVENLVFGGSGNFAATGNAQNNSITGGDGNDNLRGRGGVDVLNGGAGVDTVDYTLAAAGVTARLDTNRATNDGDGATDTFTGVENLTGSVYNDLLIGNASNNVLHGGIGTDTLLGFGGDDILWGGSGGGNNQLQGGTGNDYYVLDAFDTCVELAGEGIDTVEARIGSYTMGSNIENLLYVGGTGTFVGTGNVLDNTITGGNGNDILRGRGGNDTINGGLGKDEIQMRGLAADYTVTAEGNGYRILDSVAGRDGSTFVTSIEAIRWSNNAVRTLSYPPAAASIGEVSSKGGPEVSPLMAADADHFVLPALGDELAQGLPGLVVAKAFDGFAVLPSVAERVFSGLEHQLAQQDDWMLTDGLDGHGPFAHDWLV